MALRWEDYLAEAHEGVSAVSVVDQLARLCAAGDLTACIDGCEAALGGDSLTAGERSAVWTMLCRSQRQLLQSGAAISAWEARGSHEAALAFLQEHNDSEALTEVLLGLAEVSLAVGDMDRAAAALARAGREGPDDAVSTGRLMLLRARHLLARGELQESADEAFRALCLFEDATSLQVEAHLHLSWVAQLMGRPVEALSFALAARVSAREGELRDESTAAAARLAACLTTCSETDLADLTRELAAQGIDLYQYLDRDQVTRLIRAARQTPGM